MKTTFTTPYRGLFGAASIAACLMFMTVNPARAIVIDFESPDYTTTGGSLNPGSVVNQGGTTKWTYVSGNTDRDGYRIVGDGGSGQRLQAFDATVAASVQYNFATSNADLGGAFSGSSSVVNFSFNYTLIDTPILSGGATNARFRIGGGTASWGADVGGAGFELLQNGQIKFLNGNTSTTAKQADGTTTFAMTQGQTITVSGGIDYAAKTWWFAINGVTQTIAGTTLWATRGASVNDASITLIDMTNISGVTFVKHAFDNISVSLAPVPEPSSTGLLMGACFLPLAIFSRRFHRSNKAR